MRCSLRRACVIASMAAGWIAASPAGAVPARPAAPIPATRAEVSTEAASLAVAVTDLTGGAVAGARVALLTPLEGEVRSAMTAGDGRVVFEGLEAATYVLAVSKAGFEEHRQALVLGGASVMALDVRLGVRRISESVTVTALRGSAQEVRVAPQFVTVTSGDELARRRAEILPQALAEEPGVHVQQTSTSQGSPFVRGLTGQHVVFLIDGVRFNTSTNRPGANQYTALVSPEFIERIEVVRGPSGAQYGSDSLGGAVNLVTGREGRATGRARLEGGFDLGAASADSSASASAWVAGTRPRLAFLVEGSGRHHGDLRAGGGLDSHSVATRLLGLPSTVLGTRLQDTAFSQYGGRLRLSVQPSDNEVVTAQYIRGAQLGARRYDQLNGGAGNLVHRFDPQTLDFATARYERIGLGWFDTVSALLSFNAQRDDRTSQSVNNTKLGLRSPVTREQNRTAAIGYQAQATRRIGRWHSVVVGGEVYDERVGSTRTDFAYSAATGGFTSGSAGRARYPDGARYRTMALFAQDALTVVPGRLQAMAAVRASRFSYEQRAADNPAGAAGPMVPDYRAAFGDATFNGGLAWTIRDGVALTGSVSRGFRAPNVNDFGSIGVSGLGFEVSPDEAIRAGGRLAPAVSASASFDGAGAAAPLDPERLTNFEVGARFRRRSLAASVALFDAETRGLIERRTLLLPPGSTGATIGGQAVVRQEASGAVYTPVSNTAVFVRANGGRVRLRGVEAAATLGLPRGLVASFNVSAIQGTDLDTGLPPGLENGIPPAHGFVGLRWEPGRRSWWLEAYSLWALTQRRLSANDLSQARIGGIRTKAEISAFFANGAVVRGLVRDGRLVATGETLAEVLARVLGPDLDAPMPLMRVNPGYATLNLRGGWRLSSRARLLVIVENLLDRNYRLMGSGIDGPGFNFVVRHTVAF